MKHFLIIFLLITFSHFSWAHKVCLIEAHCYPFYVQEDWTGVTQNEIDTISRIPKGYELTVITRVNGERRVNRYRYERPYTQYEDQGYFYLSVEAYFPWQTPKKITPPKSRAIEMTMASKKQAAFFDRNSCMKQVHRAYEDLDECSDPAINSSSRSMPRKDTSDSKRSGSSKSSAGRHQ